MIGNLEDLGYTQYFLLVECSKLCTPISAVCHDRLSAVWSSYLVYYTWSKVPVALGPTAWSAGVVIPGVHDLHLTFVLTIWYRSPAAAASRTCTVHCSAGNVATGN